jgi:hypothetical protein
VIDDPNKIKSYGLRVTRRLLVIGCLAFCFVPSHQSLGQMDADFSHSSTQGRNDSKCPQTYGYWCFWFKLNSEPRGVSDECYATEGDCNCALNEWTKQSGAHPIVYRCRLVDEALRLEAAAECRTEGGYSCSLRDKIIGKLNVKKELEAMNEKEKQKERPKPKTKRKRQPKPKTKRKRQPKPKSKRKANKQIEGALDFANLWRDLKTHSSNQR